MSNSQVRLKYFLCVFPLLILLSKSNINRMAQESQVLFWSLDIIVYIIIPISTLYILYLKYEIKPNEYGLFRRLQSPLYGKKGIVIDTLFSMIFLFAVPTVFYYLAYAVWPEKGPGSIYSEIIEDYSLSAYIVAKIYLSTTAGFTEEVFYRGILFMVAMNILKGTRLAKTLFVIVSSILFAAAHIGYSMAGIVSVFVFGVSASCLYLHIRRIEPLILAHVILDMVYL